MNMMSHVLTANSLLTAFAAVGILMWISGVISKYLTLGRIHGSAIAIMLGLALAFFGGVATGGEKGLADLPALAGIGLMGGAMLRDFAIVATAFEVDVVHARKAGMIGAVALGLGTVVPFILGVLVAAASGYTDAESLTTIGAGAVTYIVGPVTGAAIGASSPVIALSIATGVFKAVIVMIGTPFRGEDDRPQQSTQRHGVRRLDGDGQRRLGWTRGDRSASGPVWRVDCDISYRLGLPGCTFGPLFRSTRDHG